MAATLRIRVLTDGSAGNLNQALGLAEAMARRLPAAIEAETVRLPPVLDRLPSRALALLGRPSARADPPPDLAIGAGRRGNLAAALLRRRTGCRAVAVLDPGLAAAAFDAVLLPEHDGRAGPRVLTTLGAMHRLTPERIAEAGAALRPAAPPPRLLLLLGGPSRSARFGAPEIAALLADLRRFPGWSLLGTGSRRTPPGAIAALREGLPGLELWDGTGPNPYPGLLAHADAVLVTEDSVNMASEAAATGRPVFVSGTGRVAPKFRRFHAALRARGITRPAASAPAAWSYPPLDEAGRMADLVLARLGFT